jgi:hypothetical protein
MEDTQVIEQKAMAIPTQAQSIVVSCSQDMERADLFNKGVKAMIKEVDDVFKPLADKAFQSHRAVTGKWAEIKKPLTDAMDIVTKKVRIYIQEEHRKAEEEERRLREEARKLEEERRLAEMEALEKEGRHEEAEEILAEPITFVAPTVQADIPTYDKRIYRNPVPKARVDNLYKLIQFVATRLDCVDYLLPNDKVLCQKAKSMGKAMNIPGVTYYEEN